MRMDMPEDVPAKMVSQYLTVADNTVTVPTINMLGNDGASSSSGCSSSSSNSEPPLLSKEVIELR